MVRYVRKSQFPTVKIAAEPLRTGRMDEALSHLSQISGFPRSAPLLILIVAANFAITAFHSYQEWKSKGAPLWRNFGAIVGLDIPDRVGFPIFTIALTLALWGLGLVGIAGWFPLVGPVGPSFAAGALGALIGARLSDTLVSHVLPHCVGYRPNPGLSSTPLYVLEALFIAVAFYAGLAADLKSARWGFALGVLLFVAVLPVLWLLRWVVPAWRRARWQRWQPVPLWASTNPRLM
jgi:hypothetical protein